MPTRLNLLSPAKQSNLRMMMYGQYSRHLLEHLFVVTAISGIVLLGGQWILDTHFQTLAANLTSLANSQAGKNKDIKMVNAIISQTANIQDKFTIWTPIIRDVANAVPDSVTLTSIHLDQARKIYTFSGIASRRDDLLLFQKQLQNLPQIASVTIPLASLVSKNNVQFSFTAALK